MRNVAAGIIIFFVVIFLGVVVFFGIIKSPNKKKNFEYENKKTSFVDSRHQYVFEYTEGVVQKKNNDDLGWVDASEKQQGFGDVSIRTKSNSGLVLLFEEGLFLKMGSDAEVKILFEDPDNIKVELVSGSVFSRLDGFDGLEYFLSVGGHNIFSDQSSFVIKKDKNLSVEIIVLEGSLIIDEDNNFSLNQKIDIIGDEISSRDVLIDDFEDGFVVWSVGEGRVKEMKKQFEKEDENESVQQQIEDIEDGNNLE